MPRNIHPEARAESGKAASTKLSKKKQALGVPMRPRPNEKQKNRDATGTSMFHIMPEMRELRRATIRRVLRKGGITHVSRTAYGPFRVTLGRFMKKMMKCAHVHAKTAGRKTVIVEDMTRALSDIGHAFYGAEAL
jgi:histone H3/H4